MLGRPNDDESNIDYVPTKFKHIKQLSELERSKNEKRANRAAKRRMIQEKEATDRQVAAHTTSGHTLAA